MFFDVNQEYLGLLSFEEDKECIEFSPFMRRSGEEFFLAYLFH